MSIKWKVKKIINFNDSYRWEDGYTQFGFHDQQGKTYVLDYDNNWFGELNNNSLNWTAGPSRIKNECAHIFIDIEKPRYLTSGIDGDILIATEHSVIRLDLEKKAYQIVITKEEYGIIDIGNCVYDKDGNIWINEITGCKVWKFDYHGNLICYIGNGKPGFQKEPTLFNEVQFNWIFDMRPGPDGNIYILDSKNYAVRMIDINNGMVKLVAGTGNGGYSGDGGNPLLATFGSNSNINFDGPWSMSIDELNNIFIGDTQNHVVRMIDRNLNIITTIAGNSNCIKGKKNNTEEKDLYNLNLPLICSLEYYNNKLFIPEWDGDLIVLEKDL